MNINFLLHKRVCDFFGCKNLAEIEIKDEIDCKNKMAFCRDCLEKIAGVYLKQTTPKALETPFKKQKKMR